MLGDFATDLAIFVAQVHILALNALRFFFSDLFPTHFNRSLFLLQFFKPCILLLAYLLLAILCWGRLHHSQILFLTSRCPWSFHQVLQMKGTVWLLGSMEMSGVQFLEDLQHCNRGNSIVNHGHGGRKGQEDIWAAEELRSQRFIYSSYCSKINNGINIKTWYPL